MGGSSSLGTSFSRSSHHPHSAHPKLINPKSGSNTSISLRRRIFAVVDSVSSSRSRDRGVTGGEESEGESQGRAICTTPGMACAGETETETDEPASSLFPTVCLFSFQSDHGSSHGIGCQRHVSQKPLPAYRPRSLGRKVIR